MGSARAVLLLLHGRPEKNGPQGEMLLPQGRVGPDPVNPIPPQGGSHGDSHGDGHGDGPPRGRVVNPAIFMPKENAVTVVNATSRTTVEAGVADQNLRVHVEAAALLVGVPEVRRARRVRKAKEKVSERGLLTNKRPTLHAKASRQGTANGVTSVSGHTPLSPESNLLARGKEAHLLPRSHPTVKNHKKRKLENLIRVNLKRRCDELESGHVPLGSLR